MIRYQQNCAIGVAEKRIISGYYARKIMHIKILLTSLLVTASLAVAAESNIGMVENTTQSAHQETFTLHTKEMLKPYEASYTVRKFGMKATINTTVSVNGDLVVYTKQTRPKGLAKVLLKEATETSVFKVSDTGLTVQKYEYTMLSKDESRNESFMLNPATQTIDGNSRGKTFSLPAKDNLIDRASMEIMLMLDAGKRTNLEYQVVERARVKEYKFDYLGQQDIRTAGSSFTCDVYKVTRSSGKRSTSLCMAEALGFIPAMVTHNENGTELKMMLKNQTLVDLKK